MHLQITNLTSSIYESTNYEAIKYYLLDSFLKIVLVLKLTKFVC